jgi:hypothetical protein
MAGRRRAAFLLGIMACTTAMLAGVALARPRCAPGSYEPLLNPLGTPFEGVSSPSEVLVIGADSVTLGVCGPTAATFKTPRRHTTIRALWPACPGLGRVRLQGTLQAPPLSCKPLAAVIRWRDQTSRRRRGLKFEALRIDEP